MHSRHRLKLSVRTLMIVVAVLGLLSWGYAMKQRRYEYRRAADRMQWSERMYKKGYVSKAQLKAEQEAFKRAESWLGR